MYIYWAWTPSNVSFLPALSRVPNGSLPLAASLSGPSRRLQKVYPPTKPKTKSHPLPAPVRSNPAAQPRSLAERLSAPAPRPLPDFKKKSTEEVVGILEKKVSATIERYQAIFDKKYLFESLLGDSQRALHRFADQLNWVSDNFDKADNWSKQQRDSISWACRCVGTVEFSTKEEPLVKRFRKVTKDLTSIANGGYLDWISL
ncbi:hypothetical protein FOMPIDRAFT_93173 [Fomitopsis schrenkii]|uniref:Uncharacterized protein n=1 Tax=Fomitopsis schrenkii TaxID=2126942 RepID=S8F5A0_FOMSC|nr:hypothetical protein FOMPIDRAFT_93173 [Fomitopsis schrenkii]